MTTNSNKNSTAMTVKASEDALLGGEDNNEQRIHLRVYPLCI